MKGRAKKLWIVAICLLIAASAAWAFSACGEVTPPQPEAVRYADFGALGDGVTDDFAAIKSAHDYANEKGLSVRAEDGAVYYIGAHTDTVKIKTDVDFGTAEFIIDDRDVTVDDRGWDIFEIAPDRASRKIEVPEGYSLTAGQKNVGMTFAEPTLLYIVNSHKKDYIRYGLNENSGSNRQEIILVDESGNVDADTPILWDYTQVTAMTAYSVTDAPITVQGGTFTTIANNAEISAKYYARGINITRSNTTLFNVAHHVTGEGDSGSPYTGFFSVSNANNVLIDSCTLSGHKTYTNIKPTGAVSQGTYDTQAKRSNKVTWLNCDQANDITDKTYWGIMSSNFCKNLRMEGCYLSRFDAHQGVYNATVVNSTLGQNLSIIGAGTLRLEKVTRLSGDHFMQLRQDYGSTWQGEVIMKDCTLKTTSRSCAAIKADWTDWDFGYTCYLPKTVTLENFVTEGAEETYVFSKITDETADRVRRSNNPYVTTERVNIKREATNIKLTMCSSDLLDNVEVVRA